jgi:hypothetical protein
MHDVLASHVCVCMCVVVQELLLERQKLVEDIRESEKNVKPALEAVVERKAVMGMEVCLVCMIGCACHDVLMQSAATHASASASCVHMHLHLHHVFTCICICIMCCSVHQDFQADCYELVSTCVHTYSWVMWKRKNWNGHAQNTFV